MEIECPKCGSHDLHADKQGFSGAQAVGGAVLTGGIGLLAGTIGSNKIKITCLACGYSFPAGFTKEQYKKQQRNKKINRVILLSLLSFVIILVLLITILK
jgi:predicted nucleic-acid-binding Zn-ribbon protein